MKSSKGDDNFLLTGMSVTERMRTQIDIPMHKQDILELPKFRFREPVVLAEYEASNEGKKLDESDAEIVRKAMSEKMRLNLGGRTDNRAGTSNIAPASTIPFSTSASAAELISPLSTNRSGNSAKQIPSARSTTLQTARSKKAAAAAAAGVSSTAGSALSARRDSKASSSPASAPLTQRSYYPQMDVPDFVSDFEDGIDGAVQSNLSASARDTGPETPAGHDSEVINEYEVVPEAMKESYRDHSPAISARYFGPGARNMFFDRMRFLHQQRTISGTACEEEIKVLHFDNEDLRTGEDYQDFPFTDLSPNGRKLAELRLKETGEEAETSDVNASSNAKADELDTEQSDAPPDDTRLFTNSYAKDFPSPHKQDNCGMPLSPRSRFIAGCLQERTNARASLILRKRLGKSIDISHMAIGNEVAKLLAQCLGDMPFIESLNINNNNLTDEGVAAILNAIAPIKTLKSLNISRNKMDDDAADALADYVKMEDCPCETLIMQVSDVDDFEGETFVRCLMENRSITEIDLSDNLIGRAENMRTVIPDMCTCSEAFAQMLQEKNCILRKLTLAWNTIRLSSSISLTQSLRNNASLTYLDLSYNSLSFDGGEALGDALLENMTLQYLNVASNNLNASATFTISTGIIENKALTRVIIDNNPIGEAGASALMQVPMTVGARCSLSAEKCNAGLVDPKCWFSHSNPLGKHELDLSKPYERAVAFALLELIANHATYIFVNAEYESPSGSRQNLNLFQTVIKDQKEKFFDERQKSIVAGLRKMRDASGDREKGIQLFHEADEDGGGSIDHEELTDLLVGVGMDVTPDMIEDILDQYDIDGQGAIGMPEFLAFLKSQYKEAVSRLEEMTEERIMAQPSQPHKKYQPPRSGKCHFYVVDGFTRKAKYSVMSSCDQEYAKTVSSEVAAMLGFAVANSKVRLGEAMQMFSTMYGEGGQKASILAELVVKLADPQDCKKLVMKVTRGDQVQINLLKNAMGGAYKPYLGVLNGYYQLDLSHPMDQIALTRLLEQSQTDNTRRQAQSPLSISQMGDTSQCGNWTSFRNEFFNNKRFAVQPDKFRPMPKSGKLNFDFSNVGRPSINEDLIIISDKRLVKILCNIYLIKEADAPFYLKKLGVWRRHLMIAGTGRGTMLPAYEYSKEKGVAIGKGCDAFYTNLENRPKIFADGFKRENITVDYKGKKSGKKDSKKSKREKSSADNKDSKGNTNDDAKGEKDSGIQASSKSGGSNPTSRRGSSELNIAAIDGSEEGPKAVDEDKDKDPGEEDGEDEHDKAHIQEGSKEHIKQIMNEEMAKYRLLIESPLIGPESKSAVITGKLEDIFANVWVLCRHVAAIILATPLGTSGRTDFFGSYHVDLIVSLFSRIVDIHNFEVIMFHLTPEECAQVYCRIGWLNIFNPTKPEGMWCLDFCRYEERLVAKMIIGLALVEPGNNWKDQSFSWAWDVDPVPGWELTTSYTKDDSLTVKGIVQVRYFSGEGKGKEGCVAHVSFRKAMYSLVLHSEDVACIDFDAMFPYLVHGSGESDDDEETKRDRQTMKENAEQALAEGKETREEFEEETQTQSSSSTSAAARPKMNGEKYLAANPTMWQELFTPPNGCQKQKNPLSLIYTTQIQKDEPPTA